MSRASRNPDLSELAAERSAADEKWKALLNDKSKVVQYLISGSKSTIKPHNVLIFVDLQGVYLALHKWLTDRNVPIHDGVLLGKFAHLQIERTAQEVAARVIASQPSPCFDLQQLFDSIKINYVEGNGSLANTTTAQHGMYLDISMKFELFYAPVPLKDLEWRLMGAAKRGSAEAREQLRKVKAGVVTRKGAFERDYKTYEDFVLYLKESIFHSRSQEGFFGYYVGEHGLTNFDEKEVDIRIAIRAMDALYGREADSLCIISSDQDFIPLHSRADDFGITSFQADLAKFADPDKVGTKIKGLQERFIRGGIEHDWPMKVMVDGMTEKTIGSFAEHAYSRDEWDALCRLHNEFNEYKVELIEDETGNLSLRLYRPE